MLTALEEICSAVRTNFLRIIYTYSAIATVVINSIFLCMELNTKVCLALEIMEDKRVERKGEINGRFATFLSCRHQVS